MRRCPVKIKRATTSIIAAFAMGVGLVGCAGDPVAFEKIYTVPQTFSTMECPELAAKITAYSRRVAELTKLMEKSGSRIANAIAYDNEYTMARANQKYAEQAAQDRGCDLAQEAKKSAQHK